jgi:hypothetical protein
MEPNETWVNHKNSLDPFFETRDHSNQWDMRGLWAENPAPSRDEEPAENFAENSDD